MKSPLRPLLVLIFLSTFLLGGCATLLGPKTHELSLGTQPAGAEVWINGVKMGETPLSIFLKADKTYVVEFKKEGYETVVEMVHSNGGAGWVVLGLLTGVVPAIIDSNTGCWNHLDQEVVSAELKKQNE
jgi:hypothetical protein